MHQIDLEQMRAFHQAQQSSVKPVTQKYDSFESLGGLTAVSFDMITRICSALMLAHVSKYLQRGIVNRNISSVQCDGILLLLLPRTYNRPFPYL